MVIDNKDFFEIVASLDSSNLHSLLDNERTYNKCSKQNFVSKFDELYRKMKTYGNTHFMVSYYGEFSEVVILKCDKSKHYLSLKLKIDQLNFELYNYVDDAMLTALQLIPEYHLELIFFKDEMIDFQPSDVYYRFDKQYNRNINNLYRLEDDLLETESIQEWLDDHEIDYERLDPKKLQYRSCYLFYDCYNTLMDFREFIDINPSAIEAVEAYSEITNSKEEEGWIVAYADLYEEVSRVKKYQTGIQLSGRYFSIFMGYKIVIDTCMINDLLYFVGLYDACVLSE